MTVYILNYISGITGFTFIVASVGLVERNYTVVEGTEAMVCVVLHTRGDSLERRLTVTLLAIGSGTANGKLRWHTDVAGTPKI